MCVCMCVCVCGLTDAHSVCQGMTGPLKRGGKVKRKRASEPRRIEREAREHARNVRVCVCVFVSVCVCVCVTVGCGV